jgi:hypothetical protein
MWECLHIGTLRRSVKPRLLFDIVSSGLNRATRFVASRNGAWNPMRNTIRHVAHVIYATIAIHASVLVSDRFKDAYADVGFDHGMAFVEAHFFHASKEEK